MEYWFTYPSFFSDSEPPFLAITLQETQQSLEIFLFLSRERLNYYGEITLKEEIEFYSGDASVLKTWNAGELNNRKKQIKKYPILNESFPFVYSNEKELLKQKKLFTRLTEEEFTIELIKLKLK